MVGFEPTQEKIAALPSYAHSIAGASSGIITRCIAQPLDVVKIRFQVFISCPIISLHTFSVYMMRCNVCWYFGQLQAEPISQLSSTSKYRSFTQACRTIYAEEGLRAFWKGHVTAQMLSISYGIVQVSTHVT